MTISYNQVELIEIIRPYIYLSTYENDIFRNLSMKRDQIYKLLKTKDPETIDTDKKLVWDNNKLLWNFFLKDGNLSAAYYDLDQDCMKDCSIMSVPYDVLLDTYKLIESDIKYAEYYSFAYDLLMNSHHNKEYVIDELINHGMDSDSALALTESVWTECSKDEDEDKSFALQQGIPLIIVGAIYIAVFIIWPHKLLRPKPILLGIISFVILLKIILKKKHFK